MGKGAWESINHVDLKILNSVSNHLYFSNFFFNLFFVILFKSFLLIRQLGCSVSLSCTFKQAQKPFTVHSVDFSGHMTRP